MMGMFILQGSEFYAVVRLNLANLVYISHSEIGIHIKNHFLPEEETSNFYLRNLTEYSHLLHLLD